MKQDIRVEKTLSSLTDAFLTLIRDRPLEKISVTAVCSLAKVSRVTYYHYFLDIFDQYQFLKKQYYEASREFFRYEGGQSPGREETTEMLRRWLEVLDEGVLGDIFTAIVKTQGLPDFLEEYHREIGRSIVWPFDEKQDVPADPETDRELMAAFCEGGFTALILRWLTARPRTYTSGQIAECIMDMVLK